MVSDRYVPEEGDIVHLSFSGYHGHEQGGVRPALVLTPRSYNQYGLALMCPITSKEKGYPFEVPIRLFSNEMVGVVLADQVQSIDWNQQNTVLKERVNPVVVERVKDKILLLLGA
ncbi:MAG: type II toxin-antitoxin system PemK/MazF family toxin [Sphaerochaeta sp.]|jgi:mRNA interferase MazF|nr:type II toxin-antitoxin system PemK/MazF family toxin [Sphaerochaeta sp.]